MGGGRGDRTRTTGEGITHSVIAIEKRGKSGDSVKQIRDRIAQKVKEAEREKLGKVALGATCKKKVTDPM